MSGAEDGRSDLLASRSHTQSLCRHDIDWLLRREKPERNSHRRHGIIERDITHGVVVAVVRDQNQVQDPRCGSDERVRAAQRHAAVTEVSIHAPRTGGDLVQWSGLTIAERFQSTPPARGATSPLNGTASVRSGFNPRPPHGGRQGQQAHERSDAMFQSTPPARGATQELATFRRREIVSIHAPRTGGDRRPHVYPGLGVRVSIHAPRTGGDARSRPSKC